MASYYPDPEGGVKSYLQADTDVQAIVANRVFFGVPRGAKEPTFPLVTVSRVGGVSDSSDAPLDLALLSIECWGSLYPNGNGNKSSATALVNAVRSALDRITSRTTTIADTDLFGVQVAGVVWLPDPDNDRPRYVITAEVTAIHP